MTSSKMKSKQRSRAESNRVIQSIDWDNQPLGQISDTQLANRLNISSSAVKRQREIREIPPSEVGENIANGRAFLSTIDWTKQPLGVISDMKLAKILGCNRTTVSRYREKLGVESVFRNEKRTKRISVQVEHSLNEKLHEVARKKKLPISTMLYLAAKSLVEEV